MLTADATDEQPPGPPVDGTDTRVPTWVGIAVGMLGLGSGLAAAELLASFVGDAASPVVEVGNRVVDAVPKPVRDWAIATFGTSDKVVLLAGIVVVLVLLAGLAGVQMVRGRRTAGLSVVGAVVVLGALTPLGRAGAGAWSVLATLLGGVVALVVMSTLARLAAPLARGDDSPDAPGPDPAVAVPQVPGIGGRRRFLLTAGGVAVATVAAGGLARWVRDRTAVAAERLGITLPEPLRPLPPVPADVSVDVAGVSEFLTPNDDFYRIDTALVVPRVSAEDWTLRVHGRVGRELDLAFAQLLDRPMIEVDATIACVSNRVGGDLVGTARWLGCRLDDLLDEAGIDPSADQVVGRSVDGFTAGFPTSVLDGRDAIIAVGMNGEPLPERHGYPARLIVPGLFGYVSATKWLSEIELTRFDEFQGYWIPRGWDVEAPVTTMSRIDTPRSGDRVAAGAELAVGGVAWAPIRGIEAVEVQVDDGPWQSAEMGADHAATTWRQWAFRFTPEPGEHSIRVRATDSDGETQTGEETEPGPNAGTGWHTIEVTAG